MERNDFCDKMIKLDDNIAAATEMIKETLGSLQRHPDNFTISAINKCLEMICEMSTDMKISAIDYTRRFK